MARSERPLDPAAGPVEAFAAELRKLRTEAGNPTYLKMHRASGKVRSKTALSEAAGGDHLPTWETVEAYVRALGADPAHWLPRWERAQDAERLRRDRTPPPSPGPPGPAPDHARTDPRPADPESANPTQTDPTRTDLMQADLMQAHPGVRGRVRVGRRWVAAGAVVLTAGLVVVVVADLGRPAAPADRSGPVAVVIQNKVAVGAGNLVEDSTPVYLSGRPIPFCSRQGCELPRTSMWSGATVPVTCRLTGTWMTNENLTSPGITRNPAGAASTTWYRAVLSDGRTGYISVVYLEPRYRHGLPLPHCT